MRCIETRTLRKLRHFQHVLVGLVLAGCAQRGEPPPPLPSGVVPSPSVAAPREPPVAPKLPVPRGPARSWAEYKRFAAERLVAANPAGTYMGVPPEPLLAIPVLEIELDRDGAIRDIKVMRHPGQARDTTQLAIDAVRRAAPFGDVSRLPRPWKFAEVFLFDDSRRFKPRTLDD